MLLLSRGVQGRVVRLTAPGLRESPLLCGSTNVAVHLRWSNWSSEPKLPKTKAQRLGGRTTQSSNHRRRGPNGSKAPKPPHPSIGPPLPPPPPPSSSCGSVVQFTAKLCTACRPVADASKVSRGFSFSYSSSTTRRPPIACLPFSLLFIPSRHRPFVAARVRRAVRPITAHSIARGAENWQPCGTRPRGPSGAADDAPPGGPIPDGACTLPTLTAGCVTREETLQQAPVPLLSSIRTS